MAKKNPSRIVYKDEKDSRTIMLEGACRELLASQILLKNGYMVSMPVADDRYDLIAEKHPNYFRIQVKPLNLKYIKDPKYDTSCDSWVINAYTNPKGKKKTYTNDDTDFVMGVEIETGNYAIIPIYEVPNCGVIRLSEKNDKWCYFNNISALTENLE